MRIVESCSPSDVVCDMFAGIGPCALPCAKRGCNVLANDLNPESYKCLVENAKLNRVTIEAFNLDGREFVARLCGEASTKFPFSVVLMNLPKDAVEFLDVFVGCMPNLEPNALLPTIYCYAFCKPESDDLAARVLKAIDWDVAEDGPLALDLRKVRDISPKKFMFCVKFVLPRSVATRSTRVKRRKVDDGSDKDNAANQKH